MPASAPKPDRRKTPARRLTRQEAFVRERVIMSALVSGVSVAEIARRLNVSNRRMQQLVRALFARRRDAMPEHFVDLQVTRLQEALLVSYSAMGGGNMKAVDRVVKIVRELDRYHGLADPAAPRLANAKKAGAKQIAAQGPEILDSREMTLPLALTAPDALPLDLTATQADRLLP